MNFICPHCDLKLKCDADLAGQVVRCPNCDGKFRVPELESGESPSGKGKGAGKSAGAAGAKGKQASTPGKGAAGKAPGHKAAWYPTDSSNVSVGISFAFGLLFMACFFLLTAPIRQSYFGELFWNRGWVPFVLVLLLGWCLAILFLKFRKLREQKRAMLLDVLPESIGKEITVTNVPNFLEHIAQLPAGLRDCLIVKRMQLGLQHFQVRHSNPEVANMMMSQSEIDASTIASSFSLLKVFLWAIPILGFIGTVIGISNAVGGFSGSLEAAQDIAVLKDSLNNVTSGLAVAFDTTLVALVMSLIISFPSSAMQKSEEDLLGWVDAYCNENLLKRLDDVGGMSGGSGDAEGAIQAISQTLTRSQQSILAEFREVQDHIGKVQEDQVAILNRMAEGIDEQLAAMEERAAAHQEKVEDTASKSVAPIRRAMKEISENAVAVQTESKAMIGQSTDAILALMTAIGEGLGSLNRVLTELGEKQVVIQQAPRKRSWLPFGRGK